MGLLYIATIVVQLVIFRVIGPHLILGVFLVFTLIGNFDWLQVQWALSTVMLGSLLLVGIFFFFGSLLSLGSVFKEVKANWNSFLKPWHRDAKRYKYKAYWNYGVIGALLTTILMVACYFITIYSWFASYLIAINWVTILLSALDKNISIENNKTAEVVGEKPANKDQRVPEVILQAFGALGGSGGLLIGIYLLRHKVVKGSFRIVTSTVILGQFLLFLIVFPGGGKLLELAGVSNNFSPAQLIWKTKYVNEYLGVRRTQDEKFARLIEDKAPIQQKKQEGILAKRKPAAKTAQDSIPPALAADIQSAKPFVTEVLEKIRCKPDDYWKQNALFATVAVPGINPSGFVGPWTGFKYPDGTCMEPVAIYGWARQHGEDDGSELSVQVKWRSSENEITKQMIKLKNLPDLGWRVTRMRAR